MIPSGNLRSQLGVLARNDRLSRGVDLVEPGAGGSREVLLGNGLRDDGGGLGGSLGRGRATEKLLGLGAVVTHVLLGQVGGLGRLLLRNGAELSGLVVDNITSLLEVVVDELLVGGVGKGNDEEGGSGGQGETPKRHDLDKVVGDEGTEERSSRSTDILGEEDALGLNDEEVDKLVHVSYGGIKSLPRDGVVTAGAKLGGQAIVEDELAGKLGKDGGTENHPCKLQGIAENIQVANSKDDRNDGGIGNSGGTRVLPREELGKERVVVGEGLAGGSRLRGSPARGSEVAKLVGGLGRLGLYILSHGAVGELLVSSSGVLLGSLDVGVAIGTGVASRGVGEVSHCDRVTVVLSCGSGRVSERV